MNLNWRESSSELSRKPRTFTWLIWPPAKTFLSRMKLLSQTSKWLAIHFHSASAPTGKQLRPSSSLQSISRSFRKHSDLKTSSPQTRWTWSSGAGRRLPAFTILRRAWNRHEAACRTWTDPRYNLYRRKSDRGKSASGSQSGSWQNRDPRIPHAGNPGGQRPDEDGCLRHLRQMRVVPSGTVPSL